MVRGYPIAYSCAPLAEFFNNHADYIAAFPTGADYGKAASTWAQAIAAAYPGVALAAVGQPSVTGNNPRTSGWNAALLPALAGSNISALTMHEYHDSQARGEGSRRGR